MNTQQNNKMDSLLHRGFKFDHSLTEPLDGVVLKKKSRIWVFSLEGKTFEKVRIWNR